MRITNGFPGDILWKAFKRDDTVRSAGVGEGPIAELDRMDWSLPDVLQVQLEIRRASDGSILSPAHGLWYMSDDIQVTAEGTLRSGPPAAPPIRAQIHPDTQAGVPAGFTHLNTKGWRTWTGASKVGGPSVMSADRDILANSITPDSVMATNVAMISLAEGIGGFVGGFMGPAGVVAGVAIAVPLAIALQTGTTVIQIANVTGSPLRIVEERGSGLGGEHDGILLARGQFHDFSDEHQTTEPLPARPKGNYLEAPASRLAYRDGDPGAKIMSSVPTIVTVVVDKVFGYDGNGGVVTLRDSAGRRFKIAWDNRPTGGANRLAVGIAGVGKPIDPADEFYVTQVETESAVPSLHAHAELREGSGVWTIDAGLNASDGDVAVILVTISDGREVYIAPPVTEKIIVLEAAEGDAKGMILSCADRKNASVVLEKRDPSATEFADKHKFEVISSGDARLLRSVSTGGYLTIYGEGDAVTTSMDKAGSVSLLDEKIFAADGFRFNVPTVSFARADGGAGLGVGRRGSSMVLIGSRWAQTATRFAVYDVV